MPTTLHILINFFYKFIDCKIYQNNADRFIFCPVCILMEWGIQIFLMWPGRSAIIQFKTI